jgi:predicted nucleotidyltransferase component of viral defense system
MQDLIRQEQFELEVLDRLNSAKLLSRLVFGGGTMLRLCYGLNRFSVDLDFWLTSNRDKAGLFKSLKACLGKDYALKDAANKFYTLLLEIKSPEYPRSLKIEIRKEAKPVKAEQAIAYSRYSDRQVLLGAVPLNEMMRSKIDAFLDRAEIRDAFDLEFLLKRGVGLDAPVAKLKMVLAGINALRPNDYKVKLSSLLEAQERKYYLKENFKLLKMAIQNKLQ